ncbi:MAG: DivIVA domain-containing protein [Mycobacteriales bacterium]
MLVWIAVVIAALVVFGAAAVITGDTPPFTPVPPDTADIGLPDRPMEPTDVDLVRFGLAFRGYRMAEVDETLDRLHQELAARDAEIERLRAAPAPDDGEPQAWEGWPSWS